MVGVLEDAGETAAKRNAHVQKELSQIDAGVEAYSGVRVFVRLRPPEEETTIEMFEFLQHRPGLVTIKDPLSAGRSEHTFEFSHVFRPEQTQEELFAPVAQSLVDSAMQGRSGCILAYGPTGSGKTYSIFGTGASGSRGLLPRAVEELFSKLAPQPEISSFASAGLKDHSDMSAIHAPLFFVSFLEVYLDQVYDLGRFSLDANDATGMQSFFSRSAFPSSFLSGPTFGAHTSGRADASTASSRATFRGRNIDGNISTGKESLEIRDGPGGTAQVRGLVRLPVAVLDEVQEIINKGLSKRATAPTASNARSSRSHTVFTIHIPKQQCTRDSKDSLVYSSGCKNTDYAQRQQVAQAIADYAEVEGEVALSFVDLAGSERLAKTKAEGTRFQEAVSINSSLTALGKVILALASDSTSTKHVPYRDSKLTRILSKSFLAGGNVAVLATLHPRMEDYEECLQTLAWANRCKNVQGQQPQVTYINKKKSNEQRIVELHAEIARLKELIKQAKAETETRVRNSGVTGIAASGHVDEIEVSIAKVITDSAAAKAVVEKRAKAAAAQPTPGASVANTNCTTPVEQSATISTSDRMWAIMDRRDQQEKTAREASIAALVSLQEERGRQAQAHEQAEQRMQMLDKEENELNILEDARKVITAELQQHGAELETELILVEDKLRQALDAQNKKHDAALDRLQKSTEKRLEDADETLLRIPTQLRNMLDIGEKKREELDEKQKASHDNHKAGVVRICKEHEKRLKDAKSQCQAQLDQKEIDIIKAKKALTELQESQKQFTGECQTELLSLYELVMRFAKLVADIDNGKHPRVWRGGLKRVVLSEGVRPDPPRPGVYPQLFNAIATEEQKLTSQGLEGLAHRASSGRSGRGGGGVAAVAAAEAMRKEDEALALEQIPAGWNTAAIGRKLCEVEEKEAAGIVAKLSATHLRRLCVELQQQSLEHFAPSEEREALRQLAINALEDGSTNAHIRDLEQRRAMEAAAFSDNVDRNMQLKSCLSSRKGSLAATSQLGSRLPSRPNSRPLTPHGGRSRPSTASNSRPATATSTRQSAGFPPRVAN